MIEDGISITITWQYSSNAFHLASCDIVLIEYNFLVLQLFSFERDVGGVERSCLLQIKSPSSLKLADDFTSITNQFHLLCTVPSIYP